MKDNIELSYFTTIEFSGEPDEEKEDENVLPLSVNGISVKKGYIKNKNFIITQSETENIAKTLKNGMDGKGAYILKDHGFKSGGGFFGGLKSVDNLIGRINNAEEKDGVVTYEGELSADEELARKVKSGLVSASSVGLRAKDVYCSICGNPYGKCGHFLGEEYPEENLHESVEEFLEEMGGVPVAALVGKNMVAIEQSIVLFPAIKEATVGASMGMDFSDDTDEFIKKTEEDKRIAVENAKKEAEPSNKSETFNNKEVHSIGSEQSTMSEREVELSVEISGLKLELEKAGNDNKGLETQLSDRDAAMVTLNAELSDVKGNLATTEALLKTYQDKEAADLAQDNKDVEDAIVALAEPLGIEYDFEAMTLAGKRGVLTTLEKSKITAQGSLPDGKETNMTEDEKREAEKAELKKRIFGE
jgi:hypothetical protein